MAALLGLDFEAAQGVARDAAGDQVCDAANDNAIGQVVVSGNKEAVERAVELAKERGARRPMLLPVSAPFHCALMQPAADVMAEALAATDISVPSVPLIANVTAGPVTEPMRYARFSSGRSPPWCAWRESVVNMKELGVDQLYELGAGKVLATMTKRTTRRLRPRRSAVRRRSKRSSPDYREFVQCLI